MHATKWAVFRSTPTTTFILAMVNFLFGQGGYVRNGFWRWWMPPLPICVTHKMSNWPLKTDTAADTWPHRHSSEDVNRRLHPTTLISVRITDLTTDQKGNVIQHLSQSLMITTSNCLTMISYWHKYLHIQENTLYEWSPPYLLLFVPNLFVNLQIPDPSIRCVTIRFRLRAVGSVRWWALSIEFHWGLMALPVIRVGKSFISG